jgi:hypothetical protein
MQPALRFEVLHQGIRCNLAGINGDGVLCVSLEYLKRQDEDARLACRVGGLWTDTNPPHFGKHVYWESPDVAVGDEWTIRILPGGEFDPPSCEKATPAKVVHDPDFGELKYSSNAWLGEFAFAALPFSTARIHLVSDESGVLDWQRRCLLELRARHAELWPEIAELILRCEPRYESREKIDEIFAPRVFIDLEGESEPPRVEMDYHARLDDCHAGFSVRLRDWTIVEFSQLR